MSQNGKDDEYDLPLPRKPVLFEGVSLEALAANHNQTFECNINIEDYEELDIPFDRIDDAFYQGNELYRAEHITFVTEPFDVLAANMTDIDNKGLLKKLTLKEGRGPLVDREDTVLVEYNMYFEGVSEPFDSTRLRQEPCRTRVKEGIIPGLALALTSMRLRETARFLISWKLAYGHLGCFPLIPPSADVLAEVEVLEIIPFSSNQDEVESSLLSQSNPLLDHVHKAKVLQRVGKEEFKKEKFDQCSSTYKEALRIISQHSLTEEEDLEIQKLKITLNLNLAVVQNRRNKPDQALIHCKEVFRYDANNRKAIFHCGRAYLLLKDFEKAGKELLKGQKCFPDCKEFDSELSKLNDLKMEIVNREQDLAKMLASNLKV